MSFKYGIPRSRFKACILKWYVITSLAFSNCESTILLSCQVFNYPCYNKGPRISSDKALSTLLPHLPVMSGVIIKCLTCNMDLRIQNTFQKLTETLKRKYPGILDFYYLQKRGSREPSHI